MAKKSMIAREVKRKKLVQKYAAKRKSLLDEFNAAKDPMQRLEIHRKIQSLPRNSAPNGGVIIASNNKANHQEICLQVKQLIKKYDILPF